MTTCTNCHPHVTSNYCCDCGRPTKLQRVDSRYVVHEIQHVLHFEKGFLHTVKELLRNPGPVIEEFISRDRSRLVKPVVFLVVTSLVYTMIEHFFHIEQGYINYSEHDDSAVAAISAWVQNHYGYANIIMGVLIAFWLKLLYKSTYNFFEILIMLCFVMGMGMLILSVFSLFEGLTDMPLLKISSITGVCYSSWAIGHFFDNKRVASYLKALVAYVLGMLSFSITIFLLGFLIDSFKA